MTDSILRLPAVMARTGLARSTIYLRMSEGTFPPQVSIGARAVGWLESAINGWIASLVEQSGQEIPARWKHSHMHVAAVRGA